MHYFDEREVRLGDHVELGGDAEGRVVAILEQAAYEDGYAEQDWSHLKSGALVASEELGIVHHPDFISGTPVRLRWRERKSPPLVQVSVYLHGDDLQPGTVSDHLGVQPDDQQTRGEWRTPDGRSGMHKIGFWMIGSKDDTFEVEHAVEAVVARLALVDMDLRNVPGVQEACLDIFVAEEEGNTRTIELSQAILARANELGLALQLTIGG